ncbi:MAG: alkaline phosphatase family protein [Bacteroidetes bacterium]|nr:alkaline phosphatase family protein [Bacteroidota bacterium]
MTKKKNKILVIGWDAADWKVIMPFIDQGKMPTIKSLMDRGVHGRIQTLDPPLSPMLWTSIATGFRADKHGIGGFVEPTPNGEGLRPVTTTSRKVKAIWNILNQEGWKSNVLAWWPSNPAEPINGVMVSNLYQVATKALGESWEMPNGTVHPEALTETMKEFRVHPHEISLTMSIPFMPNLAQDLELRKEKRTLSVLKTLANAATIHSASTYLMEESEWDFMAVYHDAIDHFCHTAMKYFPPRRPEIPEKDFEDFKNVVEAGYMFHDMMLERTLSLIDENTTVVLLSDHGFHSDHQRPLHIPNEPSGPAVEHSPYGIFVMAGPGVKKGVEVSGASVLDVTPTLLYHAGLAVGKDMEGKVLYQCFENPEAAKMVDSWEDIPGETGQHDALLREDPWAAQEALQQLVELGYIEALEDDKLKQVEKCKQENDYYVARNMINGGRLKPAIDILERIFSESKILRYGQRLAFAYLTKKMYMKCQEVLESLKLIDKEEREKRKSEVQNPDDPFQNLDYEEPMYLEYLEGLLNLAMNKPRLALPLLEKVQKKNPNNVQVAISIAQIHVLRKNFKAAQKQYITALAVDDRSTSAHYGLGLTFLRLNKFNEAVDEFLIAIEQDFFQSQIHYHLGEALAKLELWNDAVNAFNVAVRLTPGMTKAHQWLVEIYQNQLNLPVEAQQSLDFLNNNIKGEIIVCTGVDNCNYEELLTILEKGGVHVLNDPEGYKEAERMLFANSWLEKALGKAIYIPSRHLSELPSQFNYKVIYLDQSIEEIIPVRTAKLKKKVPEGTVPVGVLNTIEKEKFIIDLWIQSQPNQQVLILNWKEFLESNDELLNLLAQYLNVTLNVVEVKKQLKLTNK